MNKILFLFGIPVSALFLSCKPCVTCKHTTLPDVELCRENYESVDQYNNAIQAYQNWGYDCR